MDFGIHWRLWVHRWFGVHVVVLLSLSEPIPRLVWRSSFGPYVNYLGERVYLRRNGLADGFIFTKEYISVTFDLPERRVRDEVSATVERYGYRPPLTSFTSAVERIKAGSR